MKRHLTFCVILLAFLTLTITRIPVSAAQTKVSPTSQSTTSELMAQASENGHVRVIVALNLPFQAEAEFSTAQVSSQRLMIQQTQQQVSELLVGTGAETVATFETIPYITLDVDAAAIQRLSKSGLVRQLIKENVYSPLLDESVPHIGADDAWADGYDGTGQTVAVLDSGVERNHEFLTGKVVAEACYSISGGVNVSLCPNGETSQTGVGAATPCNFSTCFHGTHVAGIAAGLGDDFSGVAKGAKIIAIQIFHRVNNAQVCAPEASPCIRANDSDILKGLEEVYRLRSSYTIAAVNLSLGGSPADRNGFAGHCDLFYPYYYDSFAQLRASGIAVIAGSGNNRFTNGIFAPACISNAISVGSTNHTVDTIAGHSNSAAILDLLAPGVAINSSMLNNTYAPQDGTSMATPHVTGAFAVLRDAFPAATVDQILIALQITGKPVTDSANGVTTPRIQVDDAADRLVANTLPVIGKILINEIRLQNNQAIELFNAGTNAVNMTGWQFIAYSNTGTIETTYPFPTFTLNAGSYVVLNKGAGTNTSTNLYMGAYTTAWASGGSGAALLLSGNIGIDFVRWGTSNKMPPIGTGWSAPNPVGSPAGQNIGRDPLTRDIDDGGEWSAQTPTMGNVNQVTRPPNDNFANYAPILALPYTNTVVTFTASKQAGEPNPSCLVNADGSPATIGKTVWYRYTPETSGVVNFDTVGSGFDTAMAVWTGSWGALIQVGCNDDFAAGGVSRVTVTANAGVAYYVQAGGFNGAGGQLKVNVTEPPVIVPLENDEFGGAGIISSLPYTITQDTTDSTVASYDPFPPCNDDIRNTVWFRYTAPATETIRFETAGSDFDTVLTVWTGTQNDLTLVACHDDVLPFLIDTTSLIDVPVIIGKTYHIMVSGGFFPSSGSLVFKTTSLTPPPTSLIAPTLLEPINGASIISTSPTFRWLPASNATSYQFQFGTTPSLTSDPILVLGTSYTPSTPLSLGTYYWRVRSMGTGGAVSAWTAPTRTLIIGSAANAAPVLNYENALPIRLSWSPLGWALEYQVQVDTENTFADPRIYDLIVSNTTQFIELDTLAPGSYYWRVRARIDATRWGAWSTVISFTFNG